MSAPARASGSKASKKRGAASEESTSTSGVVAGDSAGKRTTATKAAAKAQDDMEQQEELEFEDPYGDEEEEEELPKRKGKKAAAAAAAGSKGAAATSADAGEDDGMDVDDGEDSEEEILDEETATRLAEEEEKAEEAASKQAKFVWRPTDAMNEDEQLDYDSTAYHMLHRLRVDWPCLSFDVLPDQLGAFRTKYPHTLYMVAGTQADHANKNKIMIMKASDLHKTKHDDRDEEDDEDSDSDAEDLDENATLDEKSFAHPGGVNRIRVCPQMPHILATQADTAHVHIWDIKPYVAALDAPASSSSLQAKPKPLHSFQFASKQEGYSMAWNPHRVGRLIAGDGVKNINLIDLKEGGGWVSDAAPFKGHSTSVEDLAWSPSEENVFASASSDKTIRIWDARTKEKHQAWIAAHKQDVNVLDWNAKVQHLLVSGSDDGNVKIWDLRNFKSSAAAASFAWHRGPITSVEWHPIEESCVAVASEDNSISIWDMALEHDELPGHGAQLQEEIPPQLFFVHQGQKQIKELHWHKQIPNCLISTAEDGFNIFKPSNMD